MANDNNEICGVCEKKIDFVRGGSVKCSGLCEKVFHKRCSKISDTAYTNLITDKSKKWICLSCDPLQTSKTVKSNSPIIASPKAHFSGDLQSQLTKITRDIENILKGQQICDKKLDSISNQMQEQIDLLNNKVTELEEENKMLKSHIDNVNYRLNIYDQLKLKNHVEICGIDKMENENLSDLVVTLSDNIGANITSNNILTVYRKRNKNIHSNGGAHPIVAVLDDGKLVNEFIKKCKKKTNLNTDIMNLSNLEKRPLYINYEITKTTQYLLRKAKEMRNQNLFKYVWVGEGGLLVRKTDTSRVIKIHSLKQLNDVGKQQI